MVGYRVNFSFSSSFCPPYISGFTEIGQTQQGKIFPGGVEVNVHQFVILALHGRRLHTAVTLPEGKGKVFPLQARLWHRGWVEL